MQPPHIDDFLYRLFAPAVSYNFHDTEHHADERHGLPVFAYTKFGNQWVNPTITVPSIAFQESDHNSSPTHASSLILEIDNQWHWSPGVTGGKLENGDVIEIFSSHKSMSIQEDHNQGDIVV